MKKFDLETKEGRHEFYKYALEKYKEQEGETFAYIGLICLCPFFEGLLVKSTYKEEIQGYDEYVTICKKLPEFFAKKPPGVSPGQVWWRTNVELFYQKRLAILKELVEETK